MPGFAPTEVPASELCLMAVDPGITGAVAFYFPDRAERIAVEDMPAVNGVVNVRELRRAIQSYAPVYAVVEKVNAMPSIPGKDGRRRSMGASSAFNFGGAFHAALATIQCCEVPLHLIEPKTWRGHFRIRGGDVGKEQGRALAIRLFPHSADRFARKKDHGRADAALLAKFGADTING